MKKDSSQNVLIPEYYQSAFAQNEADRELEKARTLVKEKQAQISEILEQLKKRDKETLLARSPEKKEQVLHQKRKLEKEYAKKVASLDRLKANLEEVRTRVLNVTQTEIEEIFTEKEKAALSIEERMHRVKKEIEAIHW